MMGTTSNLPGETGDAPANEEQRKSAKLSNDNTWEPDTQTIIRLYEKLDKEGILELQWKSPGRVPAQQEGTPQKRVEVVPATPEVELRLREKQRMLSMFEADDLSNSSHTPSSFSKTPAKTPKNAVAKASFNKIFNKVSLQSTGDDKSVNDPPLSYT